jgi:hypothetical protein
MTAGHKRKRRGSLPEWRLQNGASLSPEVGGAVGGEAQVAHAAQRVLDAVRTPAPPFSARESCVSAQSTRAFSQVAHAQVRAHTRTQ